MPFQDEDQTLSSGVAAPPTAQSSPAAGLSAAPPAAGVPQAQGAPAPATPAAPAVAPAPAAAPPTKSDTTKVEGTGFGNRMLHGILNALGGTSETEMQRDPETGKMVVSAVKSGPGSQWKRIIAGALTGAAAGAAVKPGPGNLGRSAAAGFGAGQQMVEGIEERKRTNANEDYEAGQKVVIRKAQSALLTQQIASSAWEMQRSQQEHSSNIAKDANAFNQLIASDPTHTDLGVFPTFADFMSKNSGAETGKSNSEGILQAMPEFDAKGNFAGVRGYRVTPGWGTKRNADPVKIDMGGPVNGKWVSDYQTIPANGKTNDEIMQLQKAIVDKKQQWEKEVYTQKQETERNRTSAGATVRAAELHKEGTIQAADIAADSREKVAGAKATRSDILTHDKNYVKPARETELSYQLANGVYDEYKKAKSEGKELPTGAGSMVAIGAHLGNTLGATKGMGMRVTKDLIQKHIGARSISDSAQVAIQKLVNGDALSDNQWEAFHDLLVHARENKWKEVTDEANRKHIDVDFLPPDLKDRFGTATKAEIPTGASDEVFGKDGNLVGHVVNNKFVALGGK